MATTATTTIASERRAAFIEAQRTRLLDTDGDAPELTGPWAETLMAQLRQRLPKLLPDSLPREWTLRECVVTCFTEAGDREVAKLFRSLREAMSAVALTCDGDAWWVNALTSLAFLRMLSLEVLDHHLQSRDALAGDEAESRAANFPTRHALLASMAYTTLYTGLWFDGSQSGWEKRWVDLPGFGDATDMVDAILRELSCCLSDEEVRKLPRRVNPDNPLHDEEIARLRVRFTDDRDDGVASGLCIRRPVGISDVIWSEALRQLAERLAADVVGYEERNAKHLSLEASKVTPDELAERVKQVFAQFRSTGSHPGTRPPAPVPPPSSGEEWDFFISHASEDKEAFVDGLAERLKSLRWRVWYDKEQILVGDSYVAAIENGLRRSRHAVIVISQKSIAKSGWVPAEWEALLNSKISLGEKSVFPVLLDVEHDDLIRQKPLLGRCRTANAANGTNHVADELIRAVLRRPGDNTP